jgi:hypothetical protein
MTCITHLMAWPILATEATVGSDDDDDDDGSSRIDKPRLRRNQSSRGSKVERRN